VSRDRCPELWQAEACEDGRLGGEARAAFERHAAGCAICGARRADLARLRETAARLPGLESNPFQRRRQRAELLARADAQMVRPSARRVSRRWTLLVSAALACGLAGGVAMLAVRRAAEPGALSERRTAAPTYAIQSSATGDWRVLEQGATLRLAIGAGRFELQVDKLVPGQRFLVELPDGELEVVGTRFMIESEARSTRRVTVLEGRVALRLAGQPERMIGGGESWAPVVAAAAPALPPEAEPEPVTPAAAPPARSTLPPRLSAWKRAAARQRHLPPSGTPDAPSAEAAPPAPPAPPAPTAGEDFTAAMAAFSGGDYGHAEQLFAAFEAAHPEDARVEDTAFLRIVSRMRRGDADGARALARDYLQRYPQGFRSREAATLAR
jgi:TolA-binding protein